ncbi:hypothetical protein [Streptomyces sp. MK37H]|nr:hypothetical protein [Streptomyces sp. MK37H]MBP8532216.1 hypothetical protein [Streptomyces sp. MK37H]
MPDHLGRLPAQYFLDAARPYETAAVDDVRSRARDLTAARPTTIVA